MYIYVQNAHVDTAGGNTGYMHWRIMSPLILKSTPTHQDNATRSYVMQSNACSVKHIWQCTVFWDFWCLGSLQNTLMHHTNLNGHVRCECVTPGSSKTHLMIAWVTAIKVIVNSAFELADLQATFEPAGRAGFIRGQKGPLPPGPPDKRGHPLYKNYIKQYIKIINKIINTL